MGMTRFRQLTDAQILAVCLYGEAKDKTRTEKWALALEIRTKMQGGMRLHEYFCFFTSHPFFPRLYDIAGDFTRYVEKDRNLAECYNISRSVIFGEIEAVKIRESRKRSGDSELFHESFGMSPTESI